MNGTEISKQLELAITASLKAGKAIMEVYDSTFEVEYKDDNSPLTLADKKSNDIINTFLKPTEIPIISEENKQIEFEVRRHWKFCWIVDPVDGTKEFIKRNGEFTVNIALIKEGKPLLGVIYVPAEKTLYFANVLQELAYKSELKDHETPYEVIMQKAKKMTPKASSSNLVEVV
ncbi:MAG TPA: 3'(2'),5'-bisphosphate nucleotidase CysQ, partial [Mangrovimonas sp.]|nr:3'(2'),5'-bisphosphate nucleotidase CysQ [Mangrovimonas sp.]